MTENWMDEFKVAPTGQGGQPEAWMDDFKVAPTAVKARRAVPYEAEGAPAAVRATVGSARDPDRLATLRRYYPDAEQTDDGNFVFTDPTNKKRTLYNPKGLDLGDFASLVREYAETIGGMVGGGAGFVAGGLPGAVAGAGAGTAVAGKAVDVGRSAAGLPQTYSAADTSKDIAYGAAGEVAGRALPEAGREVARWAMREGAPETVAAAARIGIEPTGSMTMRRLPAAVEHTAANVLPASRPQRTAEALYEEANRRLAAAQPVTPGAPGTVKEAASQAGNVLKESASAAYDQFRAARQRLDNSFYDQMPENMRLRLPRVKQYAQELRTNIARSPGTAAEELAPAVAAVERIEADLAANRGAVPLDVLRRTRTAVGDLLDTEATTKLPAGSQRALRSLYTAINGDLRATATVVNPRAARQLERHDRLVRAFRGEDMGRESVAGSLDSIMKANSDEMAWNALNSSQGGAERMRRLVRNMTPEQRRIVARANWDRMMTSPQGNPIDPGRWATKWINLPQEQKHLLFGETTDVGALDDLAVVLREQASGGAGRNTSGTSYDLQRADMVKSALRGLAAMTTGTMTGFPTETAITAGLGYGLAEAFYHPAVIKRALEAVTRTGQAAGVVPRATGQAATTQMRDLLGGP